MSCIVLWLEAPVLAERPKEKERAERPWVSRSQPPASCWNQRNHKNVTASVIIPPCCLAAWWPAPENSSEAGFSLTHTLLFSCSLDPLILKSYTHFSLRLWLSILFSFLSTHTHLKCNRYTSKFQHHPGLMVFWGGFKQQQSVWPQLHWSLLAGWVATLLTSDERSVVDKSHTCGTRAFV